MRWNQQSRIFPISVMSHLVLITFLTYILVMIENNNGKNYILVQGEYGAVYHMVNFAFENNCIPIYSASKRAYESKKIDEDKIENIHYFKHIKFQLYKESNRK